MINIKKLDRSDQTKEYFEYQIRALVQKMIKNRTMNMNYNININDNYIVR